MGGYIMSSTINADTTNGVVITSDTSGEIKLQSAGADIATVNSSGITLATSKDLTLSSTALDASASGIYLGGTASDNLLNDYETGTWNPVLGGSTVSGTFTADSVGYGGFYVKVGRLVTLFGNCRGTVSGASGMAIVTGLPFVRASGAVANGVNATFSAMCISYWSGISVNAGGWIVHPSNYLYSHTRNDLSSSAATVGITNVSNNIHFSGSYYTD